MLEGCSCSLLPFPWKYGFLQRFEGALLHWRPDLLPVETGGSLPINSSRPQLAPKSQFHKAHSVWFKHHVALSLLEIWFLSPSGNFAPPTHLSWSVLCHGWSFKLSPTSSPPRGCSTSALTVPRRSLCAPSSRLTGYETWKTLRARHGHQGLWQHIWWLKQDFGPQKTKLV